MAELSQRMKDVVLADPSVQTLTANKTQGVDYWVDVLPYLFPIHGEDGGVVRLLFAGYVTVDGDFTTSTDPCYGRGTDDSVPSSDPCQKEPRTFSSEHMHFPSRAVRMQVDVLTGRVYDIDDALLGPNELDKIIERYRKAKATPSVQTPLR
jgi:hypothetical protein